MIEQVSISTTNNSTVKANFFKPKTTYKKVILIVGGVGIKAKFYKAFAVRLAEEGIAVYTFDFTGIGQSKATRIQDCTSSVTDWAEHDIESMLQYILKNHPNGEVNIIAHSGGGTIVGLAPSASKVHKILLVASPRCLKSHYKGFDFIQMWLLLTLFYPVLPRIMGYFPSHWLKMGENLPKNVALEWSRWGRHPKGMEGCIEDKVKHYHAIQAPIKMISFDNDFFANPEAVQGLAHLYKNAKIDYQHFTNESGVKVGHFCFFKKSSLAIFIPFVLIFFIKN